MALSRALSKKSKEKRLATSSSYAKLYRDDYQGVQNLMKDGGKAEGEVIRQLVAEALRSRRLHAHGIDQTKKQIQIVQKKIMEELLAPVYERLDEQQKIVERVEDRVSEGFEHVGRQADFTFRALRFVIVEVMICRLLLRDYVHTVYKVFMEKIGKPVTEIEKNFKRRLEAFRAEAHGELDALSEGGVTRLQEMAGSVSRVLCK